MDLSKVCVNALALRNLTSLPFKQLRASGGDAPAALAARARWLEHGLGAAQALTAAATAALAQTVPSALVAPVRRHPTARKDANSPAIWIFGTNSDIAQACELLGAAFAETQQGVWTAKSSKQTTDALFDAILRALVAALEADGANRVGADIVHPLSNLSYRFKLMLSNGLKPTVVLRVEVYQTDLRFLDDDDTDAVLEEGKDASIHVITSPLGLRGTLSKRRLAGDALSASVLDRWREAGLLPARPLNDTAVIFLDLGAGLEIPFPRVCVLTTASSHKSKHERNVKSSERGRGRASSSNRTNETLFRSRKRPRSPSMADQSRGPRNVNSNGSVARPVVKSEPKLKMEKQNQKLETVAEFPVLSAAAFNAALAEATRNGWKDPTPVFEHPLSCTPEPPSPLKIIAASVKSEQTKGIETGAQTAHGGLSNENQNQIQSRGAAGPLPSPVDLGARGFGGSRSLNQSTDLDMFGLTQDMSSGFGGLNMDIGDVGSLDDDVSKFFGGSVDSGFLGGFDSMSPSGDGANSRPPGLGIQENGSTQPQPKSSTQKQANKSTPQPLPSPVRKNLGIQDKGIDKKNDLKHHLSSEELVHKVLSSFAAIYSPANRPTDEECDQALISLFEDDLAKRRTDLLKSRLRPSERFSRSMVCSVDAKYMPSYTRYGSKQGVLDIMSRKNPRNPYPRRVKEVYVPPRRLKMYTSMARKKSSATDISRAVCMHSRNLSMSSDEESDTESENNNMESSGIVHSSLPRRILCSSQLEIKEAGEPARPLDATKVAEAVAVDCASACLVLIEDYQRSITTVTQSSYRPGSFSGSTSSVNSSSVIGSNGHSLGNTNEAKSPALTMLSGNGAGLSPSTSVLGPSPKIPNPPANFPRSYHPPAAPSNSQRASQKRDRDANAFLALLQMQCITIEGLQLFEGQHDQNSVNNSTDQAESKTVKNSANTGTLTFKPIDVKPASAASLSRVLHGMPRTIECCKALRSYSVNTVSANCSGNMKVEGPLCVTEVYGDETKIIPLATPQVCVGYNNEWMETTANILPLWEKSGLEPYSQQKHVQYTVLAPKSFEEDAKVFFRDVSSAYEECSFGRHTPISSDPMTSIVATSSKSKSIPKLNDLNVQESALVYHFGLAVTGWCNKLTSIVQEIKRNHSGSSSNCVVVYVVSPFPRGADSANAALLRVVAPLLSSIPGITGTYANLNSSSGLQATPWRAPSSHNNGLSLHVRIFPHEAIGRNLSDWMKSEFGTGVPLRPQVVKAIAFSVYSSVRWKRLRNNSFGSDKEASGIAIGSVLSPDDQMSPMTPDYLTDPSSLSITPHSPMATVGSAAIGIVEEGPNSSLLAPSQCGMTIDQSSALHPSFLHEPAVVLAGVGSHLEQPNKSCEMVLHLAYGFCRKGCRFVFTWTDSRGEMLDMASVPVLGSGTNGTRRRAFWHMWLRGLRWRLPYIDSVHVTVSKLGEMQEGEVEDWDQVFSKILYGSVSAKSEGNERTGIVRRFPTKLSDGDTYIDHPTPATSAGMQAHSGGSGTPVAPSRNEGAVDVQTDGVRSLTLLTVRDSACERLLIDITMQKDGNEFLVLPQSSVHRGSQAKALLVGMEGGNVAVTEMDMIMHYGESNRANIESTTAEKWDAEKSSEVARTVAENFHNLRFVGTPPCWPQDRWRKKLPLHMELVRNYRDLLMNALATQSTRCNPK